MLSISQWSPSRVGGGMTGNDTARISEDAPDSESDAQGAGITLGLTTQSSEIEP